MTINVHTAVLLTSALAAFVAACADTPAGLDPVEIARSEPGVSITNPLAGAALFAAPGGPAAQQASAWRATRPSDAAAMDRLAAQPTARWIGDWTEDVRATVAAVVDAATRAAALPVLVAYNVPKRDCGGLSGGGGADAGTYRSWIDGFAAGLAGRRALVVLEPDALALTDCLSASERTTRSDLLRYAVSALSNAGAFVYLDAGHARWVAAAEMAERLKGAGIDRAAGFALNVSNFQTTQASLAYGAELSGLLGGTHFVIDTGRNGAGPAADGAWCNPSGRALGDAPSTVTGHPLADAFLWIKTPGESDGACNGGPAAGAWWPEYALGLARRAGY